MGTTSFAVSFGGSIEVSVDGGETWSRREPAQRDYARIDIPSLSPRASCQLQLRAPEQRRPLRVYSLDHCDEGGPSVTWFTSGVGGARTRDLLNGLAANDERGFRAYASMKADLLTIAIGVNDTIHADEVASDDSEEALRTILKGFARHGIQNLALVGACPVRPDYQPGPWFVSDAYTRIYRPISRELDVPLLEWNRRWGDWERGDRHGYYADQVHPSRDGHWDAGAMIADLLLRAERAVSDHCDEGGEPRRHVEDVNE